MDTKVIVTAEHTYFSRGLLNRGYVEERTEVIQYEDTLAGVEVYPPEWWDCTEWISETHSVYFSYRVAGLIKDDKE